MPFGTHVSFSKTKGGSREFYQQLQTHPHASLRQGGRKQKWFLMCDDYSACGLYVATRARPRKGGRKETQLIFEHQQSNFGQHAHRCTCKPKP